MTTPKPLSTTTLRKKITKQIYAYLQEAGFDTIKGNTAWRHLPNRIELVHFCFTNPTDSRSISCTPASFTLEQGIFFKSFPSGHVMKFEHWLPEAYDGHMRISHRRTLSQPSLKRRDIWLVELNGSNLDECIADAIAVLSSQGESWFIRNRDDSEAIRALLWDEDEGDELGITKIHYGRLGCPRRNHLIAYIAIGAGKLEIARDALDRLLNQKIPFLMAGYPDRDYKKVLELLEQQQAQEAGQANNRAGE